VPRLTLQILCERITPGSDWLRCVDIASRRGVNESADCLTSLQGLGELRISYADLARQKVASPESWLGIYEFTCQLEEPHLILVDILKEPRLLRVP
jgi:hypothetical protein